MSLMSQQSPGGVGFQKPRSSGRVAGRENEGKNSETDGSTGFRVYIVDRDSMSSHLLATALSREANSRASAVQPADLLRRLDVEEADMLIIGAEVNPKYPNELDLTQAVSRAHPRALIVVLLNHSTRDSVMNAFSRSSSRD
jgi:DNA-binding NtrC family response regulator